MALWKQRTSLDVQRLVLRRDFLKRFFFFFTLTVTHLSFSLNSWRCLFPCVSNKETIWEKRAWKLVWSHTHKKTPLQLDYTLSKNWRTTTRPTSQTRFDPWLTSVCPIQYSPDHNIAHTRPNPSIHKALTSELRRWYGIERTFLDLFFWHFPVIYCPAVYSPEIPSDRLQGSSNKHRF